MAAKSTRLKSSSLVLGSQREKERTKERKIVYVYVASLILNNKDKKKLL